MDRYQLCVIFDGGDTSELDYEFDHVLDLAEAKDALVKYLGGWIEEEGSEAAASVDQITGAVMYEIGDDDLPTGDAIAEWKFKVSVAGDKGRGFTFHFVFDGAGA